MSTDLQAQREGESDLAYRGYLAYRDQGETRSLTRAFEIYSGGKTSISGAFSRWSEQFDWGTRVRAFDNERRSRVQEAQLKSDRVSYLEKIETNRAILERTAATGMKTAELAVTMAAHELQQLARDTMDRGMTADELAILGQLLRTVKDAIVTLGAAKTEIYDALGLVKVIETVKG